MTIYAGKYISEDDFKNFIKRNRVKGNVTECRCCAFAIHREECSDKMFCKYHNHSVKAKDYCSSGLYVRELDQTKEEKK